MSQFRYRALQADGGIAEGALDAPGRHEAMRLLEARGLRPVGLFEAGEAAPDRAAPQPEVAKKKIPRRVVEDFTRQLSSLLSAGIPLARALRILSKEAASPAAGATWRAVHDRVVDGAALADALTQFP
ncbi:type II secretion system F family protein [bacterium]|nr:type II secretion system F family protein [bacterium]